MKEIKNIFDVNRLLGEYTGFANGVLAWDIPNELRTRIEQKIIELENIKVNMYSPHNPIMPLQAYDTQPHFKINKNGK